MFTAGFGQLHPRSQGITTLGTIYSSSVFENRAPKGEHLVLNFIGGATNRGIVDQSHEDLVSQVLASSYRGNLLTGLTMYKHLHCCLSQLVAKKLTLTLAQMHSLLCTHCCERLCLEWYACWGQVHEGLVWQESGLVYCACVTRIWKSAVLNKKLMRKTNTFHWSHLEGYAERISQQFATRIHIDPKVGCCIWWWCSCR